MRRVQMAIDSFELPAFYFDHASQGVRTLVGCFRYLHLHHHHRL